MQAEKPKKIKYIRKIPLLERREKVLEYLNMILDNINQERVEKVVDLSIIVDDYEKFNYEEFIEANPMFWAYFSKTRFNWSRKQDFANYHKKFLMTMLEVGEFTLLPVTINIKPVEYWYMVRDNIK